MPITLGLVGKSEGRPESWLSRISGRTDLAFVNTSEGFPEAEVYFDDVFFLRPFFGFSPIKRGSHV